MSGLTTAFVARTMRELGYRVEVGPDVAITGGAADSRKVQPGNLFTAFPGENTDGNLYVADALRAGAVAAICERAPEGPWPAQTIVVAPDATRAVGELAQAWRRHCATPVVGITGTVGKTTAKELIAATLGARFRVHRSEGNLNSREGLPLALLTLTPEHEVSVLEMGMDSRGEIARLCEIAEPRVGVVLNIGLTHVEKLGSAEAIAEEKMTLPRKLPADGTAVLNMDDRRIAFGRGEVTCPVIGFGRDDATELRVLRTEDHGLDGVDIAVAWQGREAVVRSPLPGLHVVPAALAATGVALALGMSLGEAAAAVGAAAVEGRLRRVTTSIGATILDDRYNASPASVAGALELLGRLPGRHVALLGKMAELGTYAEEEHRRIGRVAAANVDVLATFGELGRVLAAAAREAGLEDAQWFESKEDAAASLARHLRAGDTVLVKGSRSEALETILPVLEGNS
ncbi:MAG: UDP-N-acetylmuramoyl-tripeptide--D-alanyl-D-alanine ligase [Dehalococcoidia bacterium]|nr:UDP-N-acetylmuramoyl-tripeptide--D-alanyl-D-alanine ligase [Dehalococcoidia bacterium]